MKSETKTIKHTYTLEERGQLATELARAFGEIRGIETEFDGIKSTYKAKTAEAEAKVDRISTNVTNGFELRPAECWVVYRTKDKEKDYYLYESDATAAAETDGLRSIVKPVLTERMTVDDFQQELIEAESIFDKREEINLFTPTGADRGILVVGQLAGKWFSALRVNIGKLILTERLDAEQKCFKHRPDAVATAVKRVNEWAKLNLKDLAKGFESQFNAVAEAHKERAE